ncbi:MAG TPA: hypothetical protein QF550_03110, partial [Arenicellales bacterium]|nr:hypothetical protein [Arenicellales bacterium]
MVNFKLNRDFFVISNSDVSEAAPYPETVLEGLTDSGLAMARSEITSWPDYQATPLVSLDGLARQLDVNTI